MTDPAGPYSRPSSSAAGHTGHTPIPPPSPRPSVTSRGSRSSLRRQAAIAAGSASASASPQQQQPIPQPSAEPTTPRFTPFFATITSTAHPSNKSTTHHPSVHYIFADDDPDILTEALARHHRSVDAEEEPDGEPSDEQPFERAVLLDVVPSSSAPAGYEVAWASSLAPDWAVVDAKITRTDGSGGAMNHGGGGTLMLQVEGVSVEGPAPIPPASAAKTGVASPLEHERRGSRRGSSSKQHPQEHHPSEEYPALIDEFEKRIGVLRRVVEAADVRRRATDAAAGHDDVDEEDEEETQRPTDVEASREEKGKGKQRAGSLEDEDDEAGANTG